MVKLTNLSKYYHSNGMVVQALRRINLEFKMGEFVAITGESGSGKSTLLNVISGIDSYEDGELTIDGEETSYFDEADWEEYRKNKIAFIFQNYNLIDSYSVLKNVEAALVIQGLTKKERISRAKQIIDEVGLTSHLKHKASKLSGGQKQRLAIARALAKDTDIIVADEPTGNLDSESSKQIMELLDRISKNKLIFLVIHSYDQAKDYVTRKIRLFDGEVVEDVSLRAVEEVEVTKIETKKIKDFNKVVTLAKFNFLSQPKKSIFIFIVSLAIMFFVFGYYGILQFESFSTNLSEYYDYPERLIVVSKDRTPLDDVNYAELIGLNSVNSVIKADSVLDDYLSSNNLPSGNYFTGRYLYDFSLTPEYGRLPLADDEIFLLLYKYGKVDEEEINLILNKYYEFSLDNYNSVYPTNLSLKVVGISYSKTYEQGYYVTDECLDKMDYNKFINGQQVSIEVTENSATDIFLGVNIIVDERLNGNEAILSFNLVEEYSTAVAKIGPDKIALNLKNNIDFYYYNVVAISRDLAEALFSEVVHYQWSINLKNHNNYKSVKNTLNNLGYYSFSPYYDISNISLFSILDLVLSVLVFIRFFISLVLIYFISYFVFRYVLNTKIKDYSILRVIGTTNSEVKNIIRYELLISSLLSFFIFLIVYFTTPIKTLLGINLRLFDFIIVLGLNIGLILLIARKFIKKQMAKTLYTNLRGANDD